MTITRDQYAEALSLLSVRPALSRREIAKYLHISRGTIESIALGNWCPKRPPLPTTPDEPHLIARCPTCRAMVRTPCLACHIRSTLRR